MTPLPKRGNTTAILVERVTAPPPEMAEPGGDVHVAGGDHQGIVVNKSSKTGQPPLQQPEMRITHDYHYEDVRCLGFVIMCCFKNIITSCKAPLNGNSGYVKSFKTYTDKT